MRRRALASILLLSCAVTLAAEDSAPYSFVLAKSLEQEGLYAEALAAYDRALRQAPDDPYIHLELADLLLRLGELTRAVEQADAAHALAADNPDVLRTYGQTHLSLAERDGSSLAVAREAFERLRQFDPLDLQVMMSLGEIYLNDGQPDAAAAIFRDLRRLRPSSRVISSFLIESLMRGGQNREAEQVLQDLVRDWPDDLKSRLALAEQQAQRGDHRAAAETLRAAPEGQRGDLELERRLALAEFHSGDLEGALAATDAALAREPEHPGSRYLKGLVLAALGRREEAASLLRDLLAEAPDNAELALNLARVQEDGGEVAAALQTLEQVEEAVRGGGQDAEAADLKLERAYVLARAARWPEALALTGDLLAAAPAPAPVELVLFHAELMSRGGRAADAVDLLRAREAGAEDASRLRAKTAELLFGLDREQEAADELAPLVSSDDVEQQLLAAGVYQRAERYRAAVPLLARALGERPDSLDIQFSLGAAHERSGEPAEAEAVFRRLLTQDPDFAPALNYLGYMWADRGENLTEALAMISRAVAIEPDNGAYIDSLGWAHFKLGQYDEARSQLERAASLIPDDAVVFEHLGDAYAAMGRKQEARDTYRRALDLGPENRDQVEGKLRQLGGDS